MNGTQAMVLLVVHFKPAVQVRVFRLNFDQLKELAITWNFWFEHRVKSLKISFAGNLGKLGLNTRVQTRDFTPKPLQKVSRLRMRR